MGGKLQHRAPEKEDGHVDGPGWVLVKAPAGSHSEEGAGCYFLVHTLYLR